MAESEVKILTVDAVKSMADLRKAISDTKEALNGMELGSEEYQRTLAELIKEQNLMRGAMNGTTASMDDLKAAADGTTVSYNGLVNSMANMKRELRNLDLSTAEGRARFKELSQEIKNTNDALKELDEKQGSYVRNVGNYTSGLKNLGEILKNNVPALGNTAKAVGDVDKAVHLLGQQPILGIIGLLAPLLTKIAMSLKEDEGAMVAVKKIMDAMKPVTDFFAGLLEQIVDVLGDIIGRVGEFLGSSGVFQKIVQGVVGVGNAILQFVIAPFKAVSAAIKVFKEQGVKGIGDAARAMNDEFNKGIAFKQNFNAGKVAADTLIAGVKSKKKDTRKAGKEMAKDLIDGVQEGLADVGDELQKEFDDIVAKMEKEQEEANKRAQKREADSLKGLEKGTKHRLELNEILTTDEREKADQQYAIQKESNDRRLALLKQFRDDALARDDWDAYISYDQEMADLEVQIETEKLREEKRLREQDVKDAKEAAAKKSAVLAGYASSAKGMLDTLAGIFEQQGEEDEKSAKIAKNLRIASATVDMISGAVTAFSTAQQLGPIAGPIVGAINAAAVTASGLANIAKIRATNVSKDAAPTTSAPAQATVSAPSLETAVPTTTVINGARTETALNRASQPSRVYVVQSDIEAAAQDTRVQVAESSF